MELEEGEETRLGAEIMRIIIIMAVASSTSRFLHRATRTMRRTWRMEIPLGKELSKRGFVLLINRIISRVV